MRWTFWDYFWCCFIVLWLALLATVLQAMVHNAVAQDEFIRCGEDVVNNVNILESENGYILYRTDKGTKRYIKLTGNCEWGKMAPPLEN